MLPPPSPIVPVIDLDFSNPTQSNAVHGINWAAPGDVDVATFYPTFPQLYFAKTTGCTAKVYIDGGVVLELKSNSTLNNNETCGFALELPASGHDRQVYVRVEFDVAQVRPASPSSSISARTFLGAIAAVTNESAMATGLLGYPDRLSASTCQLRRDGTDSANQTKFRLNAPESSGGRKFTYTRFPFLSNFTRPIPVPVERPAFANHSTIPLVLEHTITASSSADTKADVEPNLSQHDSSAFKYFVYGTNQFKSNTYTNSLSSFRFAGVGLTVSRPPEIVEETSPGPIRVRIKRLAIAYS